ncbi:hypothetical protein ACFSO7_02850 [Bacillus sp. CGMCC 1.16607]|uniref:hypothetical protein n=1 Tax=Bacillus sp. CGMCC 1.16607 TaxID=3351842 RepID=UPI00364171CE
MEITVNEQAQRFYLALDKWADVVGHEIKVGKYRFCAIPLGNRINVSEVTTGSKVFNIPVDISIHIITESKEGSIRFFYQIGESIKRLIEKQVDFDGMLENMRKITFDRLGEMPPIENFDTAWIEADISEVLN